MTDEARSEQEFLLIELEYSLVQVHIQLEHLAEEERSRAEDILQLLRESEGRYLTRYARSLHRSSSPTPTGDTFEGLRRETIALLAGLTSAWTTEILAIAREQVREDRQRATQIANLRAGSSASS